MPIGYPDFAQPLPVHMEKAVKVEAVDVNPGEEKTLYSATGPGIIPRLIITPSDSRLVIRIYVNDELWDEFSADDLFENGYGPNTPGYRLVRYWPQGTCVIHYEIAVAFTEKFEVKVYNPTSTVAPISIG